MVNNLREIMFAMFIPHRVDCVAGGECRKGKILVGKLFAKMKKLRTRGTTGPQELKQQSDKKRHTAERGKVIVAVLT